MKQMLKMSIFVTAIRIISLHILCIIWDIDKVIVKLLVAVKGQINGFGRFLRFEVIFFLIVSYICSFLWSVANIKPYHGTPSLCVISMSMRLFSLRDDWWYHGILFEPMTLQFQHIDNSCLMFIHFDYRSLGAKTCRNLRRLI